MAEVFINNTYFHFPSLFFNYFITFRKLIFTGLSALVGTCLVQTTLGQGNMYPKDGSNSEPDNKSIAERDIANLTFFAVGLQPNKPILRFESTLIVPPGSPDASPDRLVQAIWPGLQTDTLLQNVLTNQGGKAHEWFFLPFACCHPAANLVDPVRVYPGDSITNTYLWDIGNDKWLNNWVLTPGAEGHKAGEKAFHGGLTFDQATAFVDQPNKTAKTTARPYNDAVFAIELQGLGTWDFGPVEWKNILIVANTTDSEWCTKIQTADPLNYSVTPPYASTSGNLTTCYIASMTFISPKSQSRQAKLA
ncbi:hypothetical protein LSUE1_G006078 [Lachnellula suecica]|uniref:Uncharacterized protein n=1 Tax=Lachnellula suecica TaxID=602035 RepID=A0A8T9C937_9HELO|nr:hypothetical protein LSUE1_G006078 [Lachnellula suecica]